MGSDTLRIHQYRHLDTEQGGPRIASGGADYRACDSVQSRALEVDPEAGVEPRDLRFSGPGLPLTTLNHTRCCPRIWSALYHIQFLVIKGHMNMTGSFLCKNGSKRMGVRQNTALAVNTSGDAWRHQISCSNPRPALITLPTLASHVGSFETRRSHQWWSFNMHLDIRSLDRHRLNFQSPVTTPTALLFQDFRGVRLRQIHSMSHRFMSPGHCRLCSAI